MLKLRSSEGDEFENDETTTMVLELLKKMIEKGLSDQPITPPNVMGEVLSQVIECRNKHSPELEIRKWDADFIDLDMNTLHVLLLLYRHPEHPDLKKLMFDGLSREEWKLVEKLFLLRESMQFFQ